MKIFSFFLGLTVCLPSVGCAQNRQPDLMIVPEGYVGWIQVSYGIKGAPALPDWKGFRLHKFGRDGEIRTSSPKTYGWAKDRVFYSTKTGWKEIKATAPQGNGLIWGEANGTGDVVSFDASGKRTTIRTPETLTAFIGTWKQFYDTKTKRPRSKEEKAALQAVR